MFHSAHSTLHENPTIPDGVKYVRFCLEMDGDNTTPPAFPEWFCMAFSLRMTTPSPLQASGFTTFCQSAEVE